MRVLLVAFAIATAALLQPAPAAPNAPTPTPPPSTVVGPRLSFERGIAEFRSREELPNTIYTIRGKLEVTLGTEYVVVRNFSSGETFVFPGRRLVYAGSKGFDDKEDKE